jgi:tetratricopeptide (TPR) repeat protein
VRRAAAVLIAVCGAAWVTAGAERVPAEDVCRALRHHGQMREAKACFSRLAESSDAFLQAEGYWGLGDYQQANAAFRLAAREQPRSALVRAEWGNLYLDHYQPDDAAKLFEEALQRDPNFAPAYLGLARVAGANFDPKAVAFANEALARNPKLAAAHEYLAYLALEDGDTNAATTEAQKALAISPEALQAMAVLASMDWLSGNEDSPWMQRILRVNPVYGEAYATGAHFLVLNRRYEEAVRFYRKALELDPELWQARSQLGINLLRLGKEQEAREQLMECYQAHYQDPETVNALRFLDKTGDYVTLRTASAELVLNKNEVAVLRPYFEAELERAIATYQSKYNMTLPGPVRLEVYPNHQDFIVRTLGLPGEGGLLGVTFGLVVAMDSPSARPPGEFNWASTLWHELSHVYVLTATHNLVPRWFTEGLSVHEEGAASPGWGDRVTPDVVAAMKAKRLLPVLQLDRGFLRPQYPGQVLVSYFEAGQMLDYIAQKWGYAGINGMIRSYAARKTTAQAIAENLHETPEAFDREFGAWVYARWSGTLQHFDEWKKNLETGYAELHSGKSDEALQQGRQILNLYPDYVGADSDYALIVEAARAKHALSSVMGDLERYRDEGGTNPEMLLDLARIEEDAHKTEQAKRTLWMLNDIYPENQELHERLGTLLFSGGDMAGAIREYRAVVALKPADTAQAHYDLARALAAAHRDAEAKTEVVNALEAAPDFRPAQQLLLELSH